jgi:hypothetical protein
MIFDRHPCMAMRRNANGDSHIEPPVIYLGMQCGVVLRQKLRVSP